jgi:hypothetical protein
MDQMDFFNNSASSVADDEALVVDDDYSTKTISHGVVPSTEGLPHLGSDLMMRE